MRRRAFLLRAACVGVGAGSGVAAGADPVAGVRAAAADAAPPLRVVASFSILADMAREVAGPAAEVTSLVPPNVDAHVYQPTPADVQRLARADLVLVNGLGFEGWIDRLVAASGYRGPLVVATTGVAVRKLAGGDDPHAWQSLANARIYVDNIARALTRLRPERAGLFDDRAAAYRRRIDALDREARARFDAVDPAQRRAITSHEAFGYFGAAYGIRFFAPQGWSTDADVSAADMARAIGQVRAQGVRALFVENMTDRRIIDGVAREAHLAVGGTLYSDALSAPGGAADTYLRLYARNVETIAGALQAGARLAAVDRR